MPWESLSQVIANRCGFAMHVAEDSMVCLPSGYILMTASEGCNLLRWAVSSDDQCLARVKRMFADMLESYPELRSSSEVMADFLAYISEQGV